MKEFSKVLIEWYRENRRRLPWRETTDPYKIWLSEVILQQTRVSQGTPYYNRFVEAFPTIVHLARASDDAVMRLWQGLGYYSRARNLHKCAKVVAEQYGGKFPPAYEEIIALPGVGPYTAAAIASIAFNEKVAVVDGNVYRVLARIFGIELDIASGEGKKHFQALANRLLSSESPGDHNQAVMEFGAMHCTPVNPRCGECPFGKKCIARQRNMVEMLPVKEKKLKKRTRYFYYFVLRSGRRIAMKKRTGRDIWNGLYEFLLVESATDQQPDAIVRGNALLSSLDRSDIHESGSVRHVLSHQLLVIRFFEVSLESTARLADDQLSFVSLKQAEKLPKPIAITRYLEKNEK